MRAFLKNCLFHLRDAKGAILLWHWESGFAVANLIVETQPNAIHNKDAVFDAPAGWSKLATRSTDFKKARWRSV